MRHPPPALPLLLLAACAAAPAGRDSAVAAALAADREMSSACASHDREGFLARVAADALFVADALSDGREAVGRSWAALMAPGGPELSWGPVSGEAAPSGDLVLTLGTWRLSAPGSPPHIRTGRYATVWRRDADGAMRAVLDGDATPLPPLRPSVRHEPVRTLASTDAFLVADAGLLVDGQGDRPVGRYLRVRFRDGAGLRTAVDAGTVSAP